MRGYDGHGRLCSRYSFLFRGMKSGFVAFSSKSGIGIGILIGFVLTA